MNNQVQVLQKKLALTEQVIRNMEARRTQGTALKNDITRYELQKETLKLQLAKVQDAVSYTHLDVYKRQILNDDMNFRPFLHQVTCQAKSDVVSIFVFVDVYKRQVHRPVMTIRK